jgi:lipid A 3-O-deacylase
MKLARHGSVLAASLLAIVTALCGGAARAQSAGTGLALGPVQLTGDEPSYLEFGAGAFDTQGHRESPTSPEGKVEFRYGGKLFYVGPAVGVLANTQGGIFGYAGFYANLALGPFVLTPLAAVGAYHRGGSEDLGGTFQFRTSAEVSYQFDNRYRLGVQFAHISNAGVNSHNPGDNELLLTFSIPLTLPF